MYDQLQLLYADMPELRGVRKGYATYSAYWSTLVANANQQSPTLNIFIADGFRFVWCATSVVVYDAAFAAKLAAQPYDINVVDTGTGVSVTADQAVRMENFAGALGLPLVLPYPRILPPQGGLTMTLTNRNAVAANVAVTLQGFKLYGN